MNSDNVLVAVAAIAVIVSFVGLAFTYNSIASLKQVMTGFATESGIVNVTVSTSASINVTTFVDFGAGVVNNATANATLDTEGNVVGGTWTPINTPFYIENIGNLPVDLNVSFAKNASTYLGGSSPSMKFKITNEEAGSCTIVGGVGSYTEASTSMTALCSMFNNTDSNDLISMDIQLTIPSDSFTGELTNTITLSYAGL